MRDLAFIVLFLAAFPAALRHSHVGAMLWAWVALIAPNLYLYGFAAAIPYNKIVVGLSLLSFVTDRTRKRFFIDGNFIVLTLFVLLGAIATATGLNETERGFDLVSKIVKI